MRHFKRRWWLFRSQESKQELSKDEAFNVALEALTAAMSEEMRGRFHTVRWSLDHPHDMSLVFMLAARCLMEQPDNGYVVSEGVRDE